MMLKFNIPIKRWFRNDHISIFLTIPNKKTNILVEEKFEFRREQNILIENLILFFVVYIRLFSGISLKNRKFISDLFLQLFPIPCFLVVVGQYVLDVVVAR